MGRPIDLTGKRFGLLVAIAPARTANGRAGWLCRCDCGEQVVVRTNSLRVGRAKSCGHLWREVTVAFSTTHGLSRDSEGRPTRLYVIWKNMRQRCSNPNRDHYMHYGGRGIRVCKEWSSFEAFHAWAMANGYREDLTVERIDNNGDYCPENCTWIPFKQQARNRRNNIVVVFRGEARPLAEWADRLGINPNTLNMRLHHGWSVERAMTEPVRPWSPGVAANG